jgi:dTDP-4-amino-4,6-dideoxygalactose transaminase
LLVIPPVYCQICNKMINTKFSPWPSFTSHEGDTVRRVLLSNRVNYWTGSEGRKFEQEFAAYVGVDYAIALANGTVALDLALKAIQLKIGDEVIVTSRTFIASVSCIVNSGAIPVFADVEFDSGNISARTILEKVTPRTKAIMCVHLAGWPCDMDPIIALAKQLNLIVIEDCAQAHGARYKGRSVGGLGDLAAWSFCQDKIITTGGEGGMVTTNNKLLWDKMWSFKDHGKNFDKVHTSQLDSGFRWLHDSFGTNMRMTELQAAIGRIQLTRLPIWAEQRRRNAIAISSTCARFKVLRVPSLNCTGCTKKCDTLTTTDGCFHAYYKYYVYIDSKYLHPEWNRDRIIKEINKLGVPCYQGTCSEVYLEKAFDGTKFKPLDRLPHAVALGDSSLMFLVHPTLTEDEIQLTCKAIESVMKQAESLS